MATTLSSDQVESFCRDGVLVVDDFLDESEIQSYQASLHESLLKYNVDTKDLGSTGQHLAALSSTNGSGGVLDMFYEEWKIKLATNPKLFAMTCELWEKAYFHDGEEEEPLKEDKLYYKWHPYGAFHCHRGYIYMDRICYRLPTLLSRQLGQSKKRPLQRSLTPHLDCCPDRLWESKTNKWRPIQCFVSLQDALLPNQGGFEAARGFHRDFHQWATTRQQPQQPHGIHEPSLCRGEYTHIRPREDQSVLNSVQHIPVRAGSVVFWDNRIPHANAYRHEGTEPRAVVYCSFLPDIPLNREYVCRQLEKWRAGKHPTDQWIGETTALQAPTNSTCSPESVLTSLLERRLGGLEPWPAE